MKFRTSSRIAGWVSAISGYAHAVASIYRVVRRYTLASIARNTTRFWIATRIAGWVSVIGGYAYAVIGVIYPAAYDHALASVAGDKTYISVGCVGDCIQQKAVSQTLVFGITIQAAAILLVVIGGIYAYMWPALNRINMLKAR